LDRSCRAAFNSVFQEAYGTWLKKDRRVKNNQLNIIVMITESILNLILLKARKKWTLQLRRRNDALQTLEYLRGAVKFICNELNKKLLFKIFYLILNLYTLVLLKL
jgi:hypothetical protein